MVYLGQYGELKEVQNVRLGGEGQGSSIYVRFEDSFQASLAILVKKILIVFSVFEPLLEKISNA